MQRTGARVAGVGLIVLGVVTGLVLWLLAGRRYDDAVTGLAPVPIGCTTTLEFERAGTYTFFVETRGSVGEIDGDCDADDRSYDVDDAPRVTLSLVDEGDAQIDLDRADGPTYERAGRRGVGIRTVDIADAGDYRLTATATSDDTEVLVRVGGDPSSGVGAMRFGAAAALVVGLVAGLLLLLVVGRRRPTLTPAPSSPQWPTSYPARPMAPPNADIPGAPPYTPRPPSHEPYRPVVAPPTDWQPPSRPTSTRPGEPLPPPSSPR